MSKETHIYFRFFWCPPAGRGAKNSHDRLCKWDFYIYIIDHVNFGPNSPKGGGTEKIGIKCAFLLTQTVTLEKMCCILWNFGIIFPNLPWDNFSNVLQQPLIANNQSWLCECIPTQSPRLEGFEDFHMTWNEVRQTQLKYRSSLNFRRDKRSARHIGNHFMLENTFTSKQIATLYIYTLQNNCVDTMIDMEKLFPICLQNWFGFEQR